MSAKVIVFVTLALIGSSMQRIVWGAVRCGDADLSRLTKAVYVSPAGNDSNDCGQNTTSPCKTIQKGITNCSGEGCGVLVRYGVYNTGNPVNLAAGVNLYGSCIFDETSYAYRSTVMGNPAFQAKGINKPTVVQGFVILGANAVHSGEASFSFTVSDSNGLALRQNVLASGKASNGGNGGTPSAGSGSTGSYASNAVDGAQGGKACLLSPPSGVTGKGGNGASRDQIHSSWSIFSTRADCKTINYSAAQVGNASGSASGGGAGGRGRAGCACKDGGDNAGDGGDGGTGNIGASGVQGGSFNTDTRGGFAGTIWRPNFGGAGSAGQVGSGGGGGSSGGSGTLRSGEDWFGWPGGGGGGGGCGGPGGTGAQQGGASIPLILFQSSVSGLNDANVLIPGPGGQGGKGGNGSRGGNGGSGGFGYSSGKTWVEQGLKGAVCEGYVPGKGGRGGTGGQGGAGSGGAGGNGGPSFGIALVNSLPFSATGLNIYAGQPGAGGELGPGGQNNAQNKGADGKPGLTGFSDNANSIVSYSSVNLFAGSNP